MYYYAVEGGCPLVDNKDTHTGKSIRDIFSRLFIHSLTSEILSRLRSGILRLRLRVIGVFMSTFGIYALIASLISHFFTSGDNGDTAIYFGICLAASSIPLLIYPGNLSACLTESRFGVNLCSFLGIQLEAVREEKCIGRLNAGFIAGVAAGTLTLIFSPFEIVFFLLLAAAVGTIFTMPQAGPAIIMAGLLIFDKKVHFFIIIVTLLSFLLKLARGKRSLHPKRADAVPLIFMTAVAGGIIFSAYDNITADTLWYLLAISSYFLPVFLYGDCRRIVRLSTIACTVAALIASAYTLGHIVNFTLRYTVPDSSVLLSAVSSLYAFRTGAASPILAALIPAAVGLAMRHHSNMPRLTMCLCATAMAIALATAGNISYVFSAAAATFLMLLIIGRKSVYAVLCAMLFIGTALMYTDIGSRFYIKAYETMSSDAANAGEVFTRLRSVGEYIICGKGFGIGESAPDNLYTYIAGALGIVGLIILTVFIVSVILSFTGLVKKTLNSDLSGSELGRFGAIRSAADTRIGAAVPLSACFSLLISGVFTNIMSDPISFMLIWMLGGMCVSYSRNACGELDKAKEAAYFHYSSDAAAIDITVAPRTRRRRKQS